MASRAQWRKRVAQWKKSGQTAEDFAAQEGLNPGTLRWWSSRLGCSSAGEAEVDFARLVPVEMAPPRATRRIDATFRVAPAARREAVRFLADRLLPLD
jgi:hypothetical protein